jgi:hypothetical protein
VSSDGRTGDGAGIFLTFLMIFFKKVILKFRNKYGGIWFYAKKKTKLTFVLLL